MALYWFEIRFDTELPGSTPGAMNTGFCSAFFLGVFYISKIYVVGGY